MMKSISTSINCTLSCKENNDGVTVQLTEREQEILQWLAEGLTDREIGQRIGLALNTIKWYNKRIYQKLRVGNRAAAVTRAHNLGLLTDNHNVVQTDLPTSNLPTAVTTFIERQHELDAISQLLSRSRLVTITGGAGSGKTRLALRIASDLHPYFRDGVYFVPLASVREAENILWAIAGQIGFHFKTDVTPLKQLLSFLKDKQLLLVLDNFDKHVNDAGILNQILNAAANIKQLITSRERLNLYGEAVWTLGGMQIPDDTDDTQTSEAVRLFLDRAESVNPKFTANDDIMQDIVRICHLVEGLPLGIELAATWMDILSPTEIADEIVQSLDVLEVDIRGTLNEQSSIRATFDQSWQLLKSNLQIAFRRLAVFQGGFTREAANRVAGVNLRNLQALVSKSLLQSSPDTGRFTMHSLLHHYASEKLNEARETTQQETAHATYFSDLMGQCWSQLKGQQQQSALQDIENDIENIRAAWRYWISERDVNRLKQFLHSFWVIHDIRGWYPAGITLFEEAVEMLQTLSTQDAQTCLGWILTAQGLFHAVGGLYSAEGGYRDGFALAKRGIGLLKQSKQDNTIMIVPLISLCITATQLGKRQEALEAAKTCLRISTNFGDEWGIAKAKQFLAIQAVEDKSYEVAERLGQASLNILRQLGDRWSESVVCIEVLGLLAIVQRDLDSAAQWMQQGLKAAEAISFDYSVQMAYWQLGYIEILQDNIAGAGAYWRKAMDIGGDQILGAGVTIGFGGTSSGTSWTASSKSLLKT